MKQVIITAYEQEGVNVRINNIILQTRNDNLVWEEAIKKAVSDYCHTPEGRATYAHNCEQFNWVDFIMYVPNHICVKYGILKIDDDYESMLVNTDEQLFDGFDDEEEEANTDE